MLYSMRNYTEHSFRSVGVRPYNACIVIFELSSLWRGSFQTFYINLYRVVVSVYARYSMADVRSGAGGAIKISHSESAGDGRALLAITKSLNTRQTTSINAMLLLYLF